jgi:hypothetical protein
LRRLNLPAHAERIGGLVREGWLRLGERSGVPVKTSGHAALLSLGFDHEQALALTTLVTTRMLDRGFLAGGGFYPSLAHTEQHVARYLAELAPVFGELAEAIARGDLTERLRSAGASVKHAGFARLT